MKYEWIKRLNGSCSSFFIGCETQDNLLPLLLTATFFSTHQNPSDAFGCGVGGIVSEAAPFSIYN